jgi:hypothetical protein
MLTLTALRPLLPFPLLPSRLLAPAKLCARGLGPFICHCISHLRCSVPTRRSRTIGPRLDTNARLVQPQGASCPIDPIRGTRRPHDSTQPLPCSMYGACCCVLSTSPRTSTSPFRPKTAASCAPSAMRAITQPAWTKERDADAPAAGRQADPRQRGRAERQQGAGAGTIHGCEAGRWRHQVVRPAKPSSDQYVRENKTWHGS